MDRSNSDNDSTYGGYGLADAHGHAALVLVESLLLSLISRSVLDAAEARNIVSIAIDATEEIGKEWVPGPASLRRAVSLLTDIRHSLPAIV